MIEQPQAKCVVNGIRSGDSNAIRYNFKLRVIWLEPMLRQRLLRAREVREQLSEWKQFYVLRSRELEATGPQVLYLRQGSPTLE